MKMNEIMKLLGNLDNEQKGLLNQVIFNFIREVVNFDSFSEVEVAEDSVSNIIEFVTSFTNQETANDIFLCAVEFFLTNEYPMQFKIWNCIDFMLNDKNFSIKPKDQAYLTGLNTSYMSIYEVVDVNPSVGLTVRNIVEGKKPQIIVTEILGSQQICKWDIIGARLVNIGEKYVFSSVVLMLSREEAENAIKVINSITKEMRKPFMIKEFSKSCNNPELMIKKMYAKQIAEEWLIMKAEQCANKQQQEEEFVNYDGDRLNFCRVEFDIHSPRKEIIAKINSIKELAPESYGRAKCTWLWLDDRKNQDNRTVIENVQSKELLIDTKVQDPQDGKIYRLYAELELTKDKLIIKVNSTQRANIVQDFIQNSLSTMVHRPIIKREEKLRQGNPKPKINNVISISKQADIELYHQILYEHCKEWIDTPIKALSNKTPRQAVKSVNGRIKVINLLKDMENHELRKKAGKDSHIMDIFSKIFQELKIVEEL